MKTLISTIILAFIVSAGMGQIKPKHEEPDILMGMNQTNMGLSTYLLDSTIKFINTGSYLTNSLETRSESFIINSGNYKPELDISFKKDGQFVSPTTDWDIITIKMYKKQFVWLNDSTAIFIRKIK